MNILHLIFIRPIVLLLELVFTGAYQLTGNYGAAIIIMSLAITVITLPLYWVAERWKRAETLIQNTMARDMKSIKTHYTGQKRYYLTQALYRLHDYKPLFSLRVSVGLLIQIPFFLAAYEYLSRFTGYAGVSFLGIGDLAKADTLLFGFALLPFIMTGVNLVSAWFYARDKKFSEQLQLILMALAFLILLYDRPAGLIFYWIMNNIFSLFKTMLFKRIFPPIPIEDEESETMKEWFSNMFQKVNSTVLLMAFMTLYVLQSAWHDKWERTFEYLVPLFGLAALSLSFLILIRFIKEKVLKENRLHIMLIVLLWALQITAGLFWVLRLNTTFISQNTMKRFIIITQDLIIFHSALLLLGPYFNRSNQTAQANRYNRGIFPAALAFLGTLYFIAGPLLTFASSPEDAVGTPFTLFLNGLLPLSLISLVLILCYKLLKPRARSVMVHILVTLSAMSVVYYYLLPSDYGVFNGMSLVDFSKIYNLPFYLYLFDLILVYGLIKLSGFFIKVVPRGLTAVLVLLVVSLIGQTMYESLRLDKADFVQAHDQSQTSLPANSDRIHSYSKEGENIVYFVADMFTGGYLKEILEEDPSIEEALNGFVWYPDTLSVSYRTVTSMPAMFGGWNYTAKALNETKGIIQDKYDKAFKKFFDPFIEKGYALSLVNTHFLNIRKLYPDPAILSHNSRDYRSYWESLQKEEDRVDTQVNYGTLFTMATLMKSAPYSQRKFLYDNGGWIALSTSGKFKNIYGTVLNQRPFLQLLPLISNTNSPVNTIKYFHSSLTHSPFGIDKEGNMVKDTYPDETQNNFDYGRSAYYSAHEFMRLFVDWVEWLKEEDIYDNTTIVLVSDHGNDLSNLDPYIPENLKALSEKEFSRAHALLVVKKAGSNQEFTVDNRFMSNADVPAILTGVNDPTLGTGDKNRTLPYYHVKGNWGQYLQSEKGVYEEHWVTESLFDGDYWGE